MAAADPTRRTPGPQAAIVRAVRRIPRGEVRTYGQVAAAAGCPGAARAVGRVLRDLPPGSGVPWHRVVGYGGRLSLAAFDPAAATTQRLRLEREGVAFDRRGRVRMAGASAPPTRRPTRPRGR
jgi:methylated-DNA-protein-cysteine methyltransferase-like protein